MVCPSRQVCRPGLFQKRPVSETIETTETIETIETIEMIEMIWRPAGRTYVAQGLRWGGRVEAILDSWCFGHGGWHGIYLWFGSFLKVPNPSFSDPPPF